MDLGPIGKPMVNGLSLCSRRLKGCLGPLQITYVLDLKSNAEYPEISTKALKTFSAVTEAKTTLWIVC